MRVADVALRRLPENLIFGGVIRIQNPEIGRRRPRRAAFAVQRHVAIKAFEVGAFGLRLPFGALKLDTEADDVHQRREPLVILPLHLGVRSRCRYGVSPHLVARGERYGDQRFDVLHGEHLAFRGTLRRAVRRARR